MANIPNPNTILNYEYNFPYYPPPPQHPHNPPSSPPPAVQPPPPKVQPPPPHVVPPPPHVVPPPPSHPTPPPHTLPPLPLPPPPHVIPPPPSHPTPPPHALPPLPPHTLPPSPHVLPPPPPGHHSTVIIIFVSLGGLFFLAFLSVALCCFLKKRKMRKVKETDDVKIDEHLRVQEEIVAGPHGTQAVVLTIEEDVHLQEVIRKTEQTEEGIGSYIKDHHHHHPQGDLASTSEITHHLPHK